LDTDNERVARDRLRHIDGLQKLGELPSTSRTPLSDFLDAYCRHLLASGRPKGARTDISRLRQIFGPCCPALRYPPRSPGGLSKTPAADSPAATIRVRYLEQITTLSVKTLLDEKLSEGDLQPVSANKYLEILTRMFNHAFDVHGYRCPVRGLKHPAVPIKRYKVGPPVIQFLRTQDIDAQLAAVASNAVVHGLGAVYILAGLRREEALWLTPDDVDVDRRLIHVRAKTLGGEYWCPKTKTDRVVPMGVRLHEILVHYTCERGSGGPWFFAAPSGGRWDPDNFSQRALAPLNAAAGLDWSCLDFRHTFGSQLAQRGISLYKISAFMGNSPDICRRHYARLTPELLHGDVEFIVALSPLPSTAAFCEALPKLHLEC